MQIDKDQVLELLRSQGKHDQADQAQGELPDTVDTDRDGGLLERFGLTPQMLIGLISGGGAGGALGALGGALGGGEEGKGGGLGGLLGR